MNSINLLPPDIKKGINQKKKNATLLKLLYQSILYTILVIAITVGAYFYFEQNTQRISNQLEAADNDTTAFGQLEKQSADVAGKLLAVKTIEGNLNSWSNDVAEIQKIMPSGVYLTKVSLTSDSKVRGGMSGFAKNKDSVAVLRDAMEDSEYLEFVDIENASTETDPKTGKDLESFTLSFSLAKGALDD